MNNNNNFLAFCAQFNNYSGYVPSKHTFCGHRWVFKESSKQVVDYGGVMVYGVHAHWRCIYCGKNRYKIFKGEPFNVYTRKMIAEYYATSSIWQPKSLYRQMEFI